MDADLTRHLRAVATHGASDLHLSVDRSPMIRVDGRLELAP